MTPAPSTRGWLWAGTRWFFIFLIVLATAAALFYAVEDWRGKRALRSFQRSWEAKGERFDLQSFIPGPVPPEKNFAMSPLFAPLLDYRYDPETRRAIWKDTNGFHRALEIGISRSQPGKGKSPRLGSLEAKTFTNLKAWQDFYRENTNYPSPPNAGDAARDVLYALKRYEIELAEIETASHRPYARFPTHYEEGYLALLPYLSVLRSANELLRLRSTAHLAAGESAEAARDIELSLYLAESVKSEPLLISQVVRLAMIQTSLEAVWEGLCQRRWGENDLLALQRAIGAVQVLPEYLLAMRGERAFNGELIEKLRRGKFDLDAIGGASEIGSFPAGLVRFYPSGWYAQNALLIDRLHQERTLPMVDVARHRVLPPTGGGLDEYPELRKTHPYNLLAKLLFPAAAHSVLKFAYTQSLLDQAVIACALERYRLAQGEYPAGLGSLVPKYLSALTLDVIGGQPLKYRRAATASGSFLLYSVGWNNADDGGLRAHREKSSTGTGTNRQEGDWVWSCPGE